jgi:hypothetical protein
LYSPRLDRRVRLDFLVRVLERHLAVAVRTS